MTDLTGVATCDLLAEVARRETAADPVTEARVVQLEALPCGTTLNSGAYTKDSLNAFVEPVSLDELTAYEIATTLDFPITYEGTII